MMSSDLQAAVERLRAEKDGKKPYDEIADFVEYPDGSMGTRWEVDCSYAADAYLALMDKLKDLEPLAVEIKKHIAAMAPHVRERRANALLWLLADEMLSVVRETTPGGGDAAK